MIDAKPGLRAILPYRTRRDITPNPEGMALAQKRSWECRSAVERFWRASRAHPMSEGRQAWGAPWWGARIGTLECSLCLCRDCPAGHPLCGCGAHYARQPRSSRHPEAVGLSAEIRKGRAAQITLNQRHLLTVSASLLIAFRKAPTPPDAHAHSFLAAVIIAIASLDFHSWARSCTACLLMRNPSYDPEVLLIYLIIYSTQHV